MHMNFGTYTSSQITQYTVEPQASYASILYLLATTANNHIEERDVGTFLEIAL